MISLSVSPQPYVRTCTCPCPIIKQSALVGSCPCICVLAFVRYRVLSFFFMLLTSRISLQDESRCFGLMQDARAAWEVAQASSLPFWKRVCQRSCMTAPFTQDVFSRLSSQANFTADQKRFFLNCASHFGTTGINEDGFHFCRSRDQDLGAEKLSSMDMWHTLHCKQVLTSLYKFREVELPPAGPPEEPLPDAIFTARPKNASMPVMSSVKGTGRPKWPTFNAVTALAWVEEFQMMIRLHKAGEMHKAPGSWRTCLLHPGLLVRKKSVGNKGPWYFSLGTGAHAAGAILWPACSSAWGPSTLWGFANVTSQHDLRWESVLDASRWEVLPTVPSSPLRLFLLARGKLLEPPVGFALQQSKVPVSLMQAAAHAGFWNLKKDRLQKLLQDCFLKKFSMCVRSVA